MKAVRELPALIVEVDGARLGPSVMTALVAMRLREQMSTPSQCELVFQAPPADLRIKLGATLTVQLAALTDALFTGEITGAEYVHGPTSVLELRVRAYDKLHRLRKQQPVRARVQFTANELLREFASELSMSVESTTEGPLWPYWIQHDQSNLELLENLCARAGLYFHARGRLLRVFDLQPTPGASLTLTWGESLLEVSVDLNASPSLPNVEVASWDPRDLATQTGESAPHGDSPAASSPSDAAPWTTDARKLSSLLLPDGGHAQAHAQAQHDARRTETAVVRGVAVGDGSLRPGTSVELRGVHEDIRGTYVVTGTEHRIDPELGYVTLFHSEPPEPAEKAQGISFTLGIVTRVDAASGRVRVRLPTMFDVESDWLQVVCAGAAPNKGLTILPDVEDQVVLLYALHAPALSLVLGGLYGERGPGDSGVAGDRVARFSLRTAAGHLAQFDDEADRIRLQHRSGSTLELSADRVVLTSISPLTLEAPGQAVVIRGATIDFQRG